MSSQYDFEKEILGTKTPDKKQPTKAEEATIEQIKLRILNEDKLTPNLRIIKCCANCKYFFRSKKATLRGYCWIAVKRKKQFRLATDPKYKLDQAKLKSVSVRRYATLVCDKHTHKTVNFSVEMVEKWVGKKLIANFLRNKDGRVLTDSQSSEES